MTRVKLVLLAAALVGAASFGTSYWAGRNCCETSKPGGELEWLRTSFQLTPAQFDKIKSLQEGYHPTCDRLCQRISVANAKLDQLIQSSQGVTPEIEAALKESSQVREDCRKAMLGHIYQVAAEMRPENRQRYLKLMKTRIITPPMGHPESGLGTMPAHPTCPQ
jgi:hypothetical protein